MPVGRSCRSLQKAPQSLGQGSVVMKSCDQINNNKNCNKNGLPSLFDLFYNCIISVKEAHFRLKPCLARSIITFVRVVVIIRDGTRIPESNRNTTTNAAIVVLGTVHKELLAEVEELSLLDGPVCLNGAHSCKRPARAAPSLVLHRCAVVCPIAPVKCCWDLQIKKNEWVKNEVL